MSKSIIQTFYEAFARRDAETMAACYHPTAHFRDAAFDLRNGTDIGDMWRMLCHNGRDLRIEFRNIEATAVDGAAHWEAWYTFSRTKRPVHNVIEARFRLRDGLIVEHIDTFHFWRWARQALGVPGLLLGWSGFLRRQVQQSALASLRKFQAQKG
jgi:ketosteroid isomerase-like protein